MEDYEQTEYWKRTQTFIDSIKDVKFFSMQGKPKKEWKMFYGDTWDAARDAAWDAARDAARDAALDAAWDAAWDAARDAAWDAALDATFMARLKVCFKLKIEKKHSDHIKARWEVWRRGYGLICDMNGTLYVYAKRKK